jgi:hypothetical protein
MERDRDYLEFDLDRLISRRKLLESLGKYSAVAAMILAGPTILFYGCGKEKTTQSEPGEFNDGSSPQKAIPIALDTFHDATIRASDGTVKYYKFNTTQSYHSGLISITGLSCVGQTIGKVTLLNSALNVISELEFDDIAGLDIQTEAGTWYIKFEALQGGGIVSFWLYSQSPSEWSNYNDWNNYSDAWSNYSDVWSNYSDAWTNYSDTWSNYSDTWSNYSDYGAWGNWMESW